MRESSPRVGGLRKGPPRISGSRIARTTSCGAGSPIPIVGASGGISGVLGAYLLLYPRAQVLLLIPLGFFTRLMYIPAGIVLGFWFLLQVFQGSMTSGEGGGVAWWAHIGGFVFGLGMMPLLGRRRASQAWVRD